MLPYGRQEIGDEEIEAVCQVLRSDYLTTGPAVENFELALANYVESPFAISLSSGTAALHAAMAAIEIAEGDEVVVPAITFVATSNAVLYCGGSPVFCDVDPRTLLIDPADVERKISPRTRAIVAVDYAGQPCDYQRLRTIADKHQIALIADSCHSLGAKIGNVPASRFADMSCFSFHPVKPITTGEGGAVVTRNSDFDRRIRSFRNHGIDTEFRQRAIKGVHKYSMATLGFNYRMNDIQAAIGAVQLKKLSGWTEKRNTLVAEYNRQIVLQGLPVTPLETCDNTTSASHLYVVRCDSNQFGRDHLFNGLRQRGVGCNVHYLPVYLHSFYRKKQAYRNVKCANAEAAYEEILSLPLFAAMSNRDVEFVCENIAAILHASNGAKAAA